MWGKGGERERGRRKRGGEGWEREGERYIYLVQFCPIAMASLTTPTRTSYSPLSSVGRREGGKDKLLSSQLSGKEGGRKGEKSGWGGEWEGEHATLVSPSV